MPPPTDLQVHNIRFSNRSMFATLYHFFEGERPRMLMAILTYAIKHSPLWLLPMVTARIINIITGPNVSFHAVWVNAGIMGLLLLLNIPIHTLHTWFLATATRNVGAKIRFALLKRLQELSISFHDDFQSGRLQSKVLRDVESIEMLSNHFVVTIVQNILNVAFAVVVTVRTEPRIAAFFFVAVPVFVLILQIFRNSITERNRELRSEIESMSARISDSIEMIPVTRSHAAETREMESLRTQIEKVKTKGLRVDMVNALFGSSAWVTFNLSQLLCLLFTGYMAYKGEILIGDVVMYQGFFGMIIGSIASLLNLYPEIARGFEAIRSVGEVLDSPDIERNEGKLPVQDTRGHIRFDGVTYHYHPQKPPMIKDLNLEVQPGECIAVVGKSGAGKTTLMNLIIGFRRPTAGRILLDSLDMESLDLRKYRRFLAVVPQNTILFSGTIRENITYGLADTTETKIREAISLANAAEFIDELPQGLDTAIGEHGGKLSGGQRQRIAIARALIRDPRVIIFDEATSSLDVVSEALIQEAISRLVKGRTTFIVAHRLSTIRNADRIVVLKQGRIAETGTFSELMAAQGEFYHLKNLQV